MWKYLLILAAVLYSLFPYDLLPDIIVGLGWLDDLAVLAILWHFYKRLKMRTGLFEAGSDGTSRGDRHEQQAEPRKPPPSRNPYTVLGVHNDATMDDIKQAYRHLASQYHPDKVSHLGVEFQELAEKRFKDIQEAYQEIIRTSKR